MFILAFHYTIASEVVVSEASVSCPSQFKLATIGSANEFTFARNFLENGIPNFTH